jgi:RNA polymerase sigma-70 factor (ECF subfamily)
VRGERPFADQALDWADALYNHARHLTGRDGDAEDLVQETYARALAAAPTFTVGNLKAWLFRILRNAFIDGYRRQRFEAPGADLDAAQEPERGRDAGASAALEIERLRAVTAGDIQSALAALSDDGREIILLDLEGFTESEVAEMLGCAVGTVKSRLSRARMMLRQRLEEYAR